MYLTFIFSPLLISILLYGFGSKMGRLGTIFLISFFYTYTLSCGIWLLYEGIILNNPCYYYLFLWFNFHFLKITWSFQFDKLTIIICYLILFISFLIHIYSIEYMANDLGFIRYFSLLSLFTFFMLFLIASNSLLQLFIGWEGVGLCSYLLINFWYTRIQANKAAIKALLYNKLGDIGFLIGCYLIFRYTKSQNFSFIFSINLSYFFYNQNLLFFITFFLFVGCCGKSAQIGLHLWLPDAMEGPTPVSALIHAATMVTAGVYLVIRCSYLFELNEKIKIIICLIGGLTAFFGATTALAQQDIKKMIAYSTCSQLGYMFVACGLSMYTLGLFHMLMHAFFKAVLFLAAGSLIHNLHNEQDVRKLGHLFYIFPITYICFLIASFSLLGFPFFSGFFSKDYILYSSPYFNLNFNYSLYLLLVITTIITTLYSIKLLFLIFYTRYRGYRSHYITAEESGILIKCVLIILTIPSICFGFFFYKLFLLNGNNFWNNIIFILPKNYHFNDILFSSNLLNLILLMILFGSFRLFYTLYFKNKSMHLLVFKSSFYYLYNFYQLKWFFDKFYNSFSQRVFFNIYYYIYQYYEFGWLEFININKIIIHIKTLAHKIYLIQINNLFYSFKLILLGFINLFFFFVFSEFIPLFCLIGLVFCFQQNEEE